ncbi:MAG TPA: regulatory protein RecX [Gaiellaceae bacterium]
MAQDPLDSVAFERAARSLEHRDRSRADVVARLERAGVAADELEATLEKLERVGWVDDIRFATSRAMALAERGHGDAAIRADLADSGVEVDKIDAALAGLVPELERARSVVAERGATPATARFLARKGFDDETVETVVAAGFAAGDDAGV